MNRYRFASSVSLITFLIGCCGYLFFNEWIILRNPWKSPNQKELLHPDWHKKEITLFFWRHDRWETEVITLGVPSDIQEQTITVVQAWLHEAAQSAFIHTPCSLQAALYDNRKNCIYLSFSALLFDAQKSTYMTLCLLESLLKTLRFNMNPPFQWVHLLVNHHCLEGTYIDCTRPLPITGFGIIPD